MTAVPSIGRQVHYVARGSADGVFPPVCRTAVVTEVPDVETPDGVVGLCVTNPTGLFFHPLAMGGVKQGEQNEHKVGGTWHWPERV